MSMCVCPHDNFIIHNFGKRKVGLWQRAGANTEYRVSDVNVKVYVLGSVKAGAWGRQGD